MGSCLHAEAMSSDAGSPISLYTCRPQVTPVHRQSWFLHHRNVDISLNLPASFDCKARETILHLVITTAWMHSAACNAAGDKLTFTIEEGANGSDGRVSVNYDGFIEDVSEGDILLVDGGINSLKILSKEGKDVHTEVLDGGTLKSRYWPCMAAWLSFLPKPYTAALGGPALWTWLSCMHEL